MAIVTEQNLMKTLYSYNPWWRDGSIPSAFVKHMKRVAFYESQKMLAQTSIRRFILLSGARRVGKTTIMYQLIETLLRSTVNPKRIIYLTFDHPLLKFVSMQDIVDLYINNIAVETDYYFFFDEIQYAENWNQWLKVFYDANPNWHVVATGSASPAISKGASESGAGRWTIVQVPTLTFYEYCMLADIDQPILEKAITPLMLKDLTNHEWNDIMNRLLPLQKPFNQYLLIGGFPELVLTDDVYLAQRVLREDIVDKVIKRDLPALFNIRNISVLEKLFLYLCYKSSSIINYSTVCKEIGDISRPTVMDYMDYLERANLIFQSHPIHQTGKIVLKSNPKVYIADAAMRNAVISVDDLPTNPVEQGFAVETAVYAHIATYFARSGQRAGYFREGDGLAKEIDIVVELPQSKLWIEVKYREDTQVAQKEAIKQVPQKDDQAIVVTKNPMDFGLTQTANGCPLSRIPAVALLYLIGHAESQ